MKKRLVDGERAVIAHDQAAEVAQPGNAAFDSPVRPVLATSFALPPVLWRAGRHGPRP